jgi:hypothetical protein
MGSLQVRFPYSSVSYYNRQKSCPPIGDDMMDNCPLITLLALSDANQQLEGLEKHQRSSELLASFMVTLFTVWVEIIVVLTSLCPSHS